MKFDKSKVYTSLNAEELEVGSEVILANYLESLKDQVEANSWPSYVLRLDGVMGTSSINRFKSGDGQYNLAYLVRKVGEEKPEEEKWIAYLAMPNGNGCYLTACSEDVWNEAKQIFGAKTKLFVGTKSEVDAWYKARKKFTKVIKAWEEGKAIQVYETLFKKWGDCAGTLEWYTECEYRVKPDCPCEDGIDSKACVGCEHSEDGKREYKPYVTVDEFIQDFQERFPTAVPRPAHTMPLIWIAHKTDGTTRLIVEFSDRSVKIGCKVKPVDFGKLFEYWTYTDGSPVGMEVKE